ncbi:MAG: hypothetical protein MR384_07905, partial [Lachnospiraceae bacterium]|nr:hypothetical protein [Lachnospiraceae bacterium]
ITTLMGVLSIDGIGSDLLDATNREIYTSVQWNPIPNKAEEAKSDAFLAIAGQKITVTGQLVDKNGNAVSTSGKTIVFKKAGSEIKSGDKVTVVKPAAATDTNGRSTIVLSAAQATEFTNVTAICTDNQYDVKLSIKDIVSTNADLYWVNADLQFLSYVDENERRTESPEGPKNTTSNNTIEVNVKDPTVGTPWEYGVRTVAGKILASDEKNDRGKLAGYTIDIDGLKIFTEYSDDNKGKYTAVEGEKGKVAASSEIANNDRISAKINGDSVTDKVTFIASKDGKSLPPFICVGEGTPNMNAKINMNVKWQPKGVAISMIAPQGTTMKNDKVKLYVRLTDSTGKNPLSGQEVEFASGNNKDKLASTKDGLDGATEGESVKVTTNKQGVAEVWVKARTIDADNQSSIITAKVDKMEQTASTTINWLKDDKTEEFGVVKAAKTDEKQVTVTFNHEINGDTVKAGNFKLTGENASGKKVQYDVTSVKASGNSAVLTLSETLPAGKYTVAINNDYSVDGIVYTPADVVGQLVEAQTSVDFYSTENATFNLDLNAAGTGFEIKNVSTPTDVLKAKDNSSDPDTAVTNNDKTKDFIITVDGKIVNQATPFVAYTTTGNKFTFTLSDINATLKVGTTVKVYYMGNVEGYTISNDDIMGLAINDMVAANSDTSSVNPGNKLNALTGNSLSDNDGYSYTVKVVADDVDKSLYTTTEEKDGSYSNLNKIIADSEKRLQGVELTELTTASGAAKDDFVKLEVTFYDKDKNVIGTKYLKLTKGDTSYTLSK